ncbi:uncharacterized protein QC763_506260 [Podospora pseudopauciseta]|uniref:F-box domain-containing protein n=1 Tax=Podospora pseudopauciseta TaxID=2093780 RepID=A0ABR0H941_9PEZI|nr:hypothetical protein QC763_506260 [Podospora pseudopauciseta]
MPCQSPLPRQRQQAAPLLNGQATEVGHDRFPNIHHRKLGFKATATFTHSDHLGPQYSIQGPLPDFGRFRASYKLDYHCCTMSGASCFCAICGGPFGDIVFSPPHPDDQPGSDDENDDWNGSTTQSDVAWSGPEDDSDDDDDQSQNQDSIDTDGNSHTSEHAAIEVSDDMEEDEATHPEDQEDFSESGESNQEEAEIGFDDMAPSEGSIQSEDEEALEFNEFRFDDIHWSEVPGTGYDRKILRPRHAHWIMTVYALGCNVEAPGPSKCYLSGRGVADWHLGTVTFTPGPIRLRDLNYPRTRGRRRSRLDVVTYIDSTFRDSINWVYPVHMPCLKTLCQVLTGQPDPYGSSKLDKDALFFAMNKLSDWAGGALNITYFKDRPLIPEYWESLPGNEYIHANPFSTDCPHRDQVLALVSNAIKTSQDSKYLLDDLTDKVKSDRFNILPYDLIHIISCLLPDRDLFSLCCASYIVHKNLEENENFWRYRLAKISMPWFDEALEVLSSPGNEDVLQAKYWKGLLRTLQKLLASKKLGKQGPLMGVYNRRRIWACCQRIAREYFEKVRELRERGVEAVIADIEK